MRKSGGARTCYKKNGAPKAAFATKKAAERAIPKTRRPRYVCLLDAWLASRALGCPYRAGVSR